jgi:hypothetical protein
VKPVVDEILFWLGIAVTLFAGLAAIGLTVAAVAHGSWDLWFRAVGSLVVALLGLAISRSSLDDLRYEAERHERGDR